MTDTVADFVADRAEDLEEEACRLIVWRRSAVGACDICGTFSQPLYFPLYRTGAYGWRLFPRPIVRCMTHLPEGAPHYA